MSFRLLSPLGLGSFSISSFGIRLVGVPGAVFVVAAEIGISRACVILGSVTAYRYGKQDRYNG